MRTPLLLILLSILCMVAGAWTAYSDTLSDIPVPLSTVPQEPQEFATQYIRDYYESVCQPQWEKCIPNVQKTTRWKRAPELSRLIVEAAEDAGIHFIDLLVIVQYEAGFRWNPGVGKTKNEIGLTQVHGLARQGHDLSTPEGQLKAGATWYASRLEKCDDDPLRAMQAYMSGRCNAAVRGAARRMRDIRKLKKLFYGQ